MRQKLSKREIQQRQRESSGVLVPREVARIKRLIAEGHSDRELSHIYLVSKRTISDIRRGDSWNWVEPEVLGESPTPTADLPAELQGPAAESERKMAEWLNQQAREATPMSTPALPAEPQAADPLVGENSTALDHMLKDIAKAKEPERALEEFVKGDSHDDEQV